MDYSGGAFRFKLALFICIGSFCPGETVITDPGCRVVSLQVGVETVAEILTEENILILVAYAKLHHPEDARKHSYHSPTTWKAMTVEKIIDRR